MTLLEKEKPFMNIVKNIGKGFLALFVMFILFYIGLSVFAPHKIIQIFKFQNFVITSGSMSPTIKYGDIVIVKDVKPENLHEEDIITFYVDFNLDGKIEVVTHYVAEKIQTEEGKFLFRTHRENTDVYDSWLVSEDDIIGIKVGHIKFVGKVILYIQSGFGLSIIVVDIIILYLITQIMNTFEDDKYAKNKKLLKKYHD